MRVSARFKNDVTSVRVMASHPMETGRRSDQQTGELIPAKYIQELSCEHQGKVVFIAQFGSSMSENPYLSFSFKGGQKGDTLQFRWNDNTGDVEKTDTIIK